MIVVEQGRGRPSPASARESAAAASDRSHDADRRTGRLGVVLCGGESRRMGEDKARLELGGETLLARAVRTLEAVAPRVVLAVGPRDRYAELGHRRVLDRTGGVGPLAGLEAALSEAEAGGEELLCVLACDMPGATPEVFEALLARAEATGADVTLLDGPRGFEPLLGVYRRTVLPAARRALERGDRAPRSMYPELVLELCAAPEALAADPRANLNTPEDLAAARRAAEEDAS